MHRYIATNCFSIMQHLSPVHRPTICLCHLRRMTLGYTWHVTRRYNFYLLRPTYLTILRTRNDTSHNAPPIVAMVTRWRRAIFSALLPESHFTKVGSVVFRFLSRCTRFKLGSYFVDLEIISLGPFKHLLSVTGQ